jgi:hypothetical protein
MKEKVLQIRCCQETIDRFRLLKAKGRFRNYEELLKWLMDKAEAEWLKEMVY